MRSARYTVLVTMAAGAMLAAGCTTGGGGGVVPPVNTPPTASAQGMPNSGTVPLTVGFSGVGSTDTDGTIVSFAWAYGDTVVGSGSTTSHEYTAIGTFTATLTVTDDDGATDTDTVLITVSPVADEDLDGFNSLTDCNDNDNTIFPGAPDSPGDNIDQDCDGVDGVQTAAVFVRSNGIDNSTCGDIAGPCQTIGQGEIRAGAIPRTQVLVAGGSYPKFSVSAGLEIVGGYGQNFERPGQIPAPTGSTTTMVSGSLWAQSGGSGGAGTLGVDGKGGGGSDESNDDFGAGGGGAGGARATAAGTGGTAGAASIGIMLNNSAPTLIGTQVTLGTGGNGGNGGSGGTSQSGGAGGVGGRGAGGPSFGISALRPRPARPTPAGPAERAEPEARREWPALPGRSVRWQAPSSCSCDAHGRC